MPDMSPGSAPSSSPASAPSTPASSNTDTLSSGGSSAANAGLSATVDSLLGIGGSGAAPAPDTSGDDPTAPDAAPGDGSTPSTEQAPGVQATPETPKPEADQVEDLDDGDDTELDAAQLDAAKAANLLDLKRPRGQRIYQAYKAYKEISEALGQELTVDSAKQHLEAFSDKLAMEHEFGSADPAAQANWLHNWNQTNPQAMVGVASQLADYLASQNKDAYVAMALPAMRRYINQTYIRAQSEPNPEMKKALLYTARMMDWDINDSFRTDDKLPQAQPQVDAREAALTARERQLADWNQTQNAQRSAQWSQGLDQANNSALQVEAEKALAPLKSTLSQRLYNAALDDFATLVDQHLAKDVEGERIYQIRRSQALGKLTSTDQQALAQSYAQRVSRAVKAVAPSYLKEAGVAAQAHSTARHEALSTAAAAGKAPNGTGAPVPQSIVPPQKQYASKVEQMEGMLDDMLGVKR